MQMLSVLINGALEGKLTKLELNKTNPDAFYNYYNVEIQYKGGLELRFEDVPSYELAFFWREED